MGYDIDSTQLPDWRTIGTPITVPEHVDVHVYVSDPCYGPLEQLDDAPALMPGEWHGWEIRDGRDGAEPGRVCEVRMRHTSVPARDWVWQDKYGLTDFENCQPANLQPGETVIADYRNVDAGTIAWMLTDDPTYMPNPDTMLWNQKVYTHGWGLSTMTGWGDGSYPVAAIIRDGKIVELRAQYIGEDPSPLSLDQARDLWAQAATETGLPIEKAQLQVSRKTYTVSPEASRDAGETHTYDWVNRAIATIDGYPEPYPPYAFQNAASAVYGRLSDDDKAALPQVVEQITHPDDQGWCTQQTVVDLLVDIL